MVTKDKSKNKVYQQTYNEKVRKNNINTTLNEYYEEIREILREKKSTSNDKLNKIYNITNKFAKDNC